MPLRVNPPTRVNLLKEQDNLVRGCCFRGGRTRVKMRLTQPRRRVSRVKKKKVLKGRRPLPQTLKENVNKKEIGRRSQNDVEMHRVNQRVVMKRAAVGVMSGDVFHHHRNILLTVTTRSGNQFETTARTRI